MGVSRTLLSPIYYQRYKMLFKLKVGDGTKPIKLLIILLTALLWQLLLIILICVPSYNTYCLINVFSHIQHKPENHNSIGQVLGKLDKKYHNKFSALKGKKKFCYTTVTKTKPRETIIWWQILLMMGNYESAWGWKISAEKVYQIRNYIFCCHWNQVIYITQSFFRTKIFTKQTNKHDLCTYSLNIHIYDYDLPRFFDKYSEPWLSTQAIISTRSPTKLGILQVTRTSFPSMTCSFDTSAK